MALNQLVAQFHHCRQAPWAALQTNETVLYNDIHSRVAYASEQPQ